MKYKITITDETVEIAAIALYEYDHRHGHFQAWNQASKMLQENYRTLAQVVLNAAASHVGVEQVTT